MPLKLLGRPSSINVRKVLWTLDELGVPATLEPWGSEGLSLQDPAFLALNPHALVPVRSAATWPTTSSAATCCRRRRPAEPAWNSGWTGRPPS